MSRMLDAVADFAGRHPRAAVAACALHNLLGRNRLRLGDGNVLIAPRAALRDVRIDVCGSNNRIEIGARARVDHARIRVVGERHRLRIGDECRIKAACIWMEDRDGVLEIGPETTIEEAHIAVTEPGSSIAIGRDCMLAFDVDIRCGDSHAIFDQSTGERINRARDIRIGSHVWLASHVQVLKGVTIGDGSVIGIRSVVTQDIPSGTVAAGSPARVVRECVAWSRERPVDGGCTRPPTVSRAS